MPKRPTFTAPVSRARTPGALAAAVLLAGACASTAELAPETLAVRELPATPSPHWVWVNDVAAFGIDGKAFLVDAAAGTVLGMISGGAFHDALLLDPLGKAVYSTDTFLARGTRGERTDVVSIHDARTLEAVGEVIIPPKQLLSVPTPVGAQISDDGRFVAVYNFTPAQSVSVVDVQARRFVTEIETPGCGMLYAGGPRRFLMLCANGSMLVLRLDDAGQLAGKTETAPLFDPKRDLLNEDAVRAGDAWYFVSYRGDVYTVDVSGDEPVFPAPWPLQRDAERDQWRPGGYQLVAVHAASGRLFTAMHRGGSHTHKQPGEEIWMHDLATRARLARFAVEHPVTSLQVSQDAAPLLYTVNIEHPQLEVYDAGTGRHLRSIGELGLTPAALQTP